jgi:hypothetical protein
VRRFAAVILFVLGGWMITTEVLMAWIDVGQTLAVQIGLIAICLALAAPFLLLGLWASPGDRPVELGLTIMIAAGIGAAMTLIIFVLLSDPAVISMMPSDRPVPHFRVAVLVGLVNQVVVAGGGWLLYRFGQKRGGGRASIAR